MRPSQAKVNSNLAQENQLLPVIKKTCEKGKE